MSKTSPQQQKGPKNVSFAELQQTTPNGGDVRIKTNAGDTYIAATQRADGSWRKPRRVRAGYVPQDEQPRFECRAQAELRFGSGAGANVGGGGSKLPLGWDPVEMAKGASATPVKHKQHQRAKPASTDTVPTSVLFGGLPPVAAVERPQAPITPADHLRKQRAKLEKKLDEIDKLKLRIASGELAKPEQTQLDKLARRGDLEHDIELLNEQLANL